MSFDTNPSLSVLLLENIHPSAATVFGAKNLRVNAGDEHLLKVGPVENADLTACRQLARGAPQKIVFQLLGARVFELNTWQPWGLTPDMTCSMAPSLPAASMAWKMSSSA